MTCLELRPVWCHRRSLRCSPAVTALPRRADVSTRECHLGDASLPLPAYTDGATDTVPKLSAEERGWLLAAARSRGGLHPPKAAFVAAGREALYRRLQQCGGLAVTASALGVAYRKGPSGQRFRGPLLSSLRQVRQVIVDLGELGVCSTGSVPSRQQLRDAGKLPLYCRLTRLFGGMPALAARLGLRYEGRTVRRNDGVSPSLSQDELFKEVNDLAAARSGRMPSLRSLKLAGRVDIACALIASGGPAAVAQRLGLKPETRGRRSAVQDAV
jgi:hypothetical protein